MSTAKCLEVLFGFICLHGAVTGSLITLTASPTEVDAVTTTMTLHCGLTDTALTTTSPSLSQRSVVQTSDDVPFVTSVVISRGKGEHVASVSQFSSADVFVDANTTHVKGEVSSASGERAYLEVTWSFPSVQQTGQYVCHVNGADKLGRAVTFSDSLVVTWVTPTVEQLAKDIRDLAKLLDQKEEKIQTLQTETQTLLNQTLLLNNNVQDLQTQNQDLNNKLLDLQQEKDADIAAARHVESGQLSCGPSGTWTGQANGRKYKEITGRFSKTYDTPPTVHMSVLNQGSASKIGSSNSFYFTANFALELMSVDRNGFTARCMTTDHSYHRLDFMAFSWLSVPH